MDTLSEQLPEFPSLRSLWRHANGNLYRVEDITNVETDRQDRYPTSVSYRNVANGKAYSRRLADWHRSMTLVSDAEPTVDQIDREIAEASFVSGEPEMEAPYISAKQAAIVARGAALRSFMDGQRKGMAVNYPDVTKDELETVVALREKRAIVSLIPSFVTGAEVRPISDREGFMIEAVLHHGFEMANDDGTVFLATQNQVFSLLRSYRSPDQTTAAGVKLNDWIETAINEKAVRPLGQKHRTLTAEDAAEIARGAVLAMIGDKAKLIDNLANEIHARNVAAGWWNDLRTGEDLHGRRNIGELLCLVHSELTEAADGTNAADQVLFAIRAEIDRTWEGVGAQRDRLLAAHAAVDRAMEGHRKALMDDKLPHRPTFRVELVDALIRILDILGSDNREHPAGSIFTEKLAYNAGRADHKPENRRAAGGKAF